MLGERDVVERLQRVSLERLRLWVERGWVRPISRDGEVLFSEVDVARCALICDLHDTLELNDETVPVILHLIDQIHGLRHELKSLLCVLDSLPEDIRATIKLRLKEMA